MAKTKSIYIEKAEECLREKHFYPFGVLDLVKFLKKEQAFGYARRILALARQHIDKRCKDYLKLAQAHALCTYKDPDLPTTLKLDRALEILMDAEELDNTKNQETLGLAGAIYKRKWETRGLTQYLERSLAYYLRGYKEGVGGDQGYTGINAAFVLDVLADEEEREAKKAGGTSRYASERREEAQFIRRDIVSKLPGLSDEPDQAWLKEMWWYWVTIAEAHFGIRQFQEALTYLNKANELKDIPDWERESTARQLVFLLRIQNGDCLKRESMPWKVFSEFLGENSAAIDSVYTGKIGLALSGGGFRASLFHIGVLARLAEMDVLRKVEVISCVSGGSIIGAHYYLEVKHLLETKNDSAITHEDYINIVKRIENDFLSGVQRNIRTRVATNVYKNMQMLFGRRYSRTMRAGELYEQELFAKVQDGKGTNEWYLDDLKISPLGEKPDFYPKVHNWRRAAKAPIIVFNATTLNTGHNWQFTATWMGEPPVDIDTEIDANYRLRRMYYEDAPAPYKRVRLGHAVAASACVPGVFEPISFDGLYPGKVVRLVDGGVHDNQGIPSLLEQGCTVLLVSDASGQMNAENDPSCGILGVPLRANSILMTRVREAQYRELNALKNSTRLKGLMYVHLKQDLDLAPVDWLGCEIPSESAIKSDVFTPYGVNKEYQRCLAGIRTDLDSFSDIEAYCLMTSGYLMTKHLFPKCVETFVLPTAQSENWRFLRVEADLKRHKPSRSTLKQLTVASQKTFKIWRLSRPLQIIAGLLGLALLIALIICHETWWTKVIIKLTLGMSFIVILASVANQIFGPSFMKLIRYHKTLKDIGIALGMCLIGWVFAQLHLRLFDKLFLDQGRVK